MAGNVYFCLNFFLISLSESWKCSLPCVELLWLNEEEMLMKCHHCRPLCPRCLKNSKGDVHSMWKALGSIYNIGLVILSFRWQGWVFPEHSKLDFCTLIHKLFSPFLGFHACQIVAGIMFSAVFSLVASFWF